MANKHLQREADQAKDIVTALIDDLVQQVEELTKQVEQLEAELEAANETISNIQND